MSKKKKENPAKIKKTDISNLKLTIELVPQKSWGDNLRSKLSKTDWNKLRSECFENAQYACEICNNKDQKLDCHELWNYNDDLKIQKLNGLISLCQDCHSVKHIGLAYKMNKGEKAISHLAQVNKMSIKKAENYKDKCLKKWRERSQTNWKVELDWLTSKGIEFKDKKEEETLLLSPLEVAINANDQALVEKILLETKTINPYKDHKGNNLLHRLIESKNLDMIKLLLEKPSFLALINECNKLSMSPLLLACKIGNKAIVELLITHGADISKKCQYHKTLLHYAVGSDDYETFDYIYNNFGNNFLSEVDFKKGLFFHRIMSTEKNAGGFNLPREKYLARKKMLELVLDDLTKEQIIQKDIYNKTFMHCMAYFGDKKNILKTLKKGGVEVINAIDIHGKMPINEAALARNIEAVETLLAKKASFKHKTGAGETAYELVERFFGNERAENIFGPYMN